MKRKKMLFFRIRYGQNRQPFHDYEKKFRVREKTHNAFIDWSMNGDLEWLNVMDTITKIMQNAKFHFVRVELIRAIPIVSLQSFSQSISSSFFFLFRNFKRKKMEKQVSHKDSLNVFYFRI